MTAPDSRRLLAAAVAVLFVIVGCSSGPGEASTPTAAAPSTASAAASTPSATPASTGSTTPAERETRRLVARWWGNTTPADANAACLQLGSQTGAVMDEFRETVDGELDMAAALDKLAELCAAAPAATPEPTVDARCADFAVEWNDPTYSHVNILFHAVEDGRLYILSSGDEVTVEEFVAACPEFAKPFRQMRHAVEAGEVFDAGAYVVGRDIPAGTYETTGSGINSCYWARTGGSGDIIENDFTGLVPDSIRVTVREGEGFEASDECGIWQKR